MNPMFAAALVGFLVLTAWIIQYLSTATALSAQAAVIARNDPSKTQEEVNSEAAAAVSANALASLRNKEQEAYLAKLAAEVKQMEASLEILERDAMNIVGVNPAAAAETERRATELEASARAARANLEKEWEIDLNQAISCMNTAKNAAVLAVAAYESAKQAVVNYEQQAEKWRNSVQVANNVLQRQTSTAAREAAEKALYEARAHYDEAMRQASLARITMNSVGINAQATIGNANDAVGDVISLTRALQNLGILLALANRTDTLANSTRDQIRKLEAKL